ncbi:hypothetical protein HMPREF9440_01214 [Sutterella parvirubra YIT 11816]|uniref:Uncharacterized protein n=1 Tax=Sutterella parvirubra YIT 11816 TaxID=762967 RepID=H3KEP9_9BURK|nr:hypothetical protein HMPREF9440_01214 [Sutterella parvirubra YIT 11816]
MLLRMLTHTLFQKVISSNLSIQNDRIEGFLRVTSLSKPRVDGRR